MLSAPAAEVLANARSFLFVPGDQPDRFTKAALSNADVVVLDLEDAVAEQDKEIARIQVRAYLEQDGHAVVRLNAAFTDHFDADVSAIRGLPGLSGVILPKACSPGEVGDVGKLCGCPVLPLIESAAGLEAVREVARAPRTHRLMLGAIDLALDLGCAEDWEPLLHARSTLVLASRAANLPPPVDGVTVELNRGACGRDAVRARGLGFGGKLLIHPSQVKEANAAFGPSDYEIEWARSVLSAGVDGVGTVEGQMVDRPVLERARQVMLRVVKEAPHG